MVIVVKPAIPAHSPQRPDGERINPGSPGYDPELVYILELATIIALRDQNTIRIMGKDVFEALHNLIRTAASTHPVVVSRAVFYLLRLLCVSHVSDRCLLWVAVASDTLQEQPFIRAPVILHTISSFTQATLTKSALPILQGFDQCIRASNLLMKEIVNSPDFWSVLQNLHKVQEVSATVFQLLEHVTIGSPSAVTADNYEYAIALLNDCATAGSVGAVQEQRIDKSARRTKPTKTTKPQ